jgi:hypothetical protein
MAIVAAMALRVTVFNGILECCLAQTSTVHHQHAAEQEGVVIE